MVVISGLVCVYYNIIITWTFYYFFHSFFPTLPWSTCENSWNTDACALKTRNDSLGKCHVTLLWSEFCVPASGRWGGGFQV